MIDKPMQNHAANDLHRPQFHFLPTNNWMNDPNGLIQWKGQYHLFYQFNPYGAFHGTIHWGHAVSSDLIHWKHLPIALAPTPGGPDQEGCWSGCAVNNNGVPTLFYTGVSPQVQCTATSSDDLMTWEKNPQPVIADLPEEIRPHAGGHVRDPFVWKEQGQWYMLLGSKKEGTGGLLLLYHSADLRHWEYLHPLMAGDVHQARPFYSGTMWECPNLLDFGDKRAVFFSVQGASAELLYVLYSTGSFQEQQFIPEFQDLLVYGNSFYAPQVLRVDDGRYIVWGWLREERSLKQSMDSGWNGVMSLPLQATLRPDGKLTLEPVEELKGLRRDHFHREGLEVKPTGSCLLEDIRGDALEILLHSQPDPAAEFGITLHSTADGVEGTRILYQPQPGLLIIRRTSLDPEVDTRPVVAPLHLAAGEPLRLHIFLDHSVVEAFANGYACLACRIYPTGEDHSNRLELFSTGEVTITSLDVWKMANIWE